MTTTVARIPNNMTAARALAVLWAGFALAVLVVSAVLAPAGNWQALAALAVIGVIAESRAMPITERVELSVAFIPVVLTAVLFGPFAGGLVGAVCMLADLRSAGHWLFYVSNRIVSGTAAGVAAMWVLRGVDAPGLLLLLAASLAAATAMTAVDFSANAVRVRLTGLATVGELQRLVRASLGITMALYTPLVALYAYAYLSAGLLVLPFFLIPLMAAHLSHSMFAEQRSLINQLTAGTVRLEEANRRLQRVNLSFATAMVRALEARDRYTAGHSRKVAAYAQDIAREMGLGEDELRLVHVAGLVHDIGKIGLPAEVLEKTSALTDDEWALMRQHASIGAEMLSEVEHYRDVAEIVRHHHERMDGAGYPDGLAGEAIPLLARVISVADAYEAMTSDRAYRRRMDPRVAMSQLTNGRDTQFDPRCADAFLALLERAPEWYVFGNFPEDEHERPLHDLAPAAETRADVA
jgi:putative nucleotidyltransferase with HDIG domain